VRKLLADNEALRARLDSLAAAPRAAAPAPPAPAAVAPAPAAPAPVPAPAPPDPGEALRRLVALIGEEGTYTETSEGARIRLTRSTAFRSGGAEPGPELREDLRKLALFAFRFPAVTFVVEGHPDSVGSPSRNRDLAQARAAAVRDELVRLGVEPVRVGATGMGSAAPIADNSTAEGRALNRRVEIRVIRGAQGDNR
jgi:outer membrane protein OmpA-like peptidoglycan-associated protein